MQINFPLKPLIMLGVVAMLLLLYISSDQRYLGDIQGFKDGYSRFYYTANSLERTDYQFFAWAFTN